MDQKAVTCATVLCLSLAGCSGSAESKLRKTLASQTTGIVQLPSGSLRISRELVVGFGSHDLEIVGSGTVLEPAKDFQGRALLVIEGGRNIRLRDLHIDGLRTALATPLDMAPPENALRVWYPNNGILADQTEGLEITNVTIANVVNFPILVSRSSKIRILDTTVEDSGSLDARGRNNLSGGILIEEGSSDFEVRDSRFERISGNALWTHSLATSPRLARGVFAGNRFDLIGRDAIQVGHAIQVRVESNSGQRIGYPVAVVDVEHGGTPVAIDTAGNVDASAYVGNAFEEINGKCFDLDGFHDGAVRDNRCTNRKSPNDYPAGHFGIVMNNTDPDAHSQNIELTGNVIDGTKFGALFVMGSGHTITGNHFLHINKSGCNESAAQFGCIYKSDEPEMLQSGIYLGRGVARLEQTRNNVIENNEISGHQMRSRCVAAGPGVQLAENRVSRNTCSDYSLGK